MFSVKTHLAVLALALGSIPVLCAAQAGPRHAYRWTKFVQVEGQPEPVPAEWVATPEGRFAHSIRVPNPVPKDSGYRKGMTSEQYFEHLCRTEAGEFIYKTVENVEGFYFMRPPKRPTDEDLTDRYKLEAPEIERTYQLVRAVPEERGMTFVNPPWALFSYVEERSQTPKDAKAFIRIKGYQQNRTPMSIEIEEMLQSRHGLTWRGLKRANDRELGIAGNEWIVIDLKSAEILAVQRDFGLTGRTPNAPEGIWWLNAVNCPKSSSKHIRSSRIYEFVTKSLRPRKGESR